jgi:alginate O-acetyltransferase complex protein AlgI
LVLNSGHFAIFFLAVVLLYFALPHRWRWALLLAASYYFYMCSKPIYVLVLLGTTVVSYLCGLKMGSVQSPGKRRSWLLLGLMVDLGLLFTFKYLGFFTRQVEGLLHHFNIIGGTPELKLLVPLGISFYTLQTLSYLLDVYRGGTPPERHFGYLALYVSFFPTVSAGPIERGAHLLPQLHRDFDFDYERVAGGLQLIAWGLFKKMVIADRLGVFVNQVYGNVRAYRGAPLLLATLLFAVQLYADFSGYTDIVRGCARVFGYDILPNFNLPYFAGSVREFWRRWHMSMTTWFRDYLYIPLGGNRKSRPRTYLNIMVVFLVSGLWHGANWTFVVWGALHCVYVMVSRATGKARERLLGRMGIDPSGRLAGVYKAIITFCLVDFAWIFFRASSVSEALYVVRNMFAASNVKMVSIASVEELVSYAVVTLLLFAVDLAALRGPLLPRLARQTAALRWAVYCALILMILVFGVAGAKQFVYVQF